MVVMLIIIVAMLNFLAAFVLLYKAEEYYSIRQLIVPVMFNWGLHEVALGSGWYLFLPFLLIVLVYFHLLFLVAVLIWHILFSIALASAYGETKFFGIILILLPVIGMIILGLRDSHYQGPVGLLDVFRKEV